MEIKKMVLPLAELELNNGQIEGLPANPRQWTLTDVEKLAASLKETPELLEMRCPIVVPHEGKYVVLRGNLRLAAARVNKDTELPCFVLEDATTDKMKEIAIKDNGSFGKWDFDSLANEWTDLPLNDWGLSVWEPEEKLPDELAGVDLNPADLPKYTEEGQTEMERVIIVYKPEDREKVEGLLGIKIEKIVYELKEIMQ